MIIVSACLCGINTRYDGGSSSNEKVLKLLKEGKAIPICPEQLGGLKTPRCACEISVGSGKDVIEGTAAVISKDNENLTREFLKGAYEALKISKICEANTAILKSNSPSCGCGKIYDGSFTGNKISGNGITAELFIRNGIKVYTEKEEIDNITY
ncbi:uncharacterized protein YbbK (DUF523 family) [Clostridium algifaecis]|uniref:Uncharacterized protein YbbK (DUF523 family) n=1 Tax=Clostridium algifaecis TaxID=1472040 RepID=A0ABS4KQW8_9CLOT|nr:DUF523 domain-containing protein [Clostridium algifaecis]MBP2032448.1 uncharacterized protein YbbK (DUF523 family) [Clostridium algifaecis]